MVSEAISDGDEWPTIRERILASEILIMAVPTWLGGQNWTYWNKGPGPGAEEWLNTDERKWSISTGKACASNLLALALALQASPIPPPPE